MIKYFLIIFLILVIIFLGYFSLVYYGIYYSKDAGSQEEIYFIIEKGQGIKEIAQNLEDQDLIKDKWYFVIYVLFRDIAKELKAGDYLLSPSMAVPTIAEKFYAGDIARESLVIFE